MALEPHLQEHGIHIDQGIDGLQRPALPAFFAAAAVISAQTYRAAAANPPDSIRYE